MMKKFLIWLLAVLAGAAVMVGAVLLIRGVDPQPSTTPENAQQMTVNLAPDFTVVDGNGQEVKLSDLRGKPVVLNFWASWCPPCKAEMPDFETMYQKYGQDVHFMIVNLTDGQSETVDSAKQHIADNGYTFPVYFDTQMQASSTYGISSIPQTFFISAEGSLVTYAQGMISGEKLESGIQLILDCA